ncbi:hypothetical protein B0H10DRAFT_2028036 [Mycena sp. CBHHK59/15]|nr:hypothetical protein B0H10DRAFT_2028036 [Mycena sp. CBHHK59/15]
MSQTNRASRAPQKTYKSWGGPPAKLTKAPSLHPHLLSYTLYRLAITMLFSSSFVSTVLMLSSVNALPQSEEHRVLARVSNVPCASGSYINGTSCAVCPVGNSCDGKDIQKCDSGHYQPMTNSSSCLATVPGFYQPNKGANDTTPCPAGSYQPCAHPSFTSLTHTYTFRSDAAQAFCYGAPKGRFQNLTGQATVCGACCGWEAPLQNFNTQAVNCSAGFSAYASSGDGCRSANQVNCNRTATCVQFTNGTCPIGSETFRG